MTTYDYHVDNFVNTLDLRWDTSANAFLLKILLMPVVLMPTKRQLLSEIARFFEPLGWLSSVLQDLRLLGIDCDSSVNGTAFEALSRIWSRSAFLGGSTILPVLFANITDSAMHPKEPT